MNTQQLQKIKAQLNEVRRWFYLNAEKILGVDITGIPLPRVEPTVSGFSAEFLGPSYEYLDLTPFDRQQQEEASIGANDMHVPRIYVAMGDFLYKAVQYIDARQSVAEGEAVKGLPTMERKMQRSLRELERVAEFPLFPEGKSFAEDAVHQAHVAYMLATAAAPLTFEQAEFTLEKQRAGLTPL